MLPYRKYSPLASSVMTRLIRLPSAFLFLFFPVARLCRLPPTYGMYVCNIIWVCLPLPAAVYKLSYVCMERPMLTRVILMLGADPRSL